MSLSLHSLLDYRLGNSPDEALPVQDVLIDEATHEVRYLVVDASGWMSQRQVLIAPSAIQRISVDEHWLVTELSRERIENSPPIPEGGPISRQAEAQLASYYQWPIYWQGLDLAPTPTYLPAYSEQGADDREQAARAELKDPDDDSAPLRSFRAMRHYRVKRHDANLGELEDLEADPEGWSLQHLVVAHEGRLVRYPAKMLLSVGWDTQVIELR